MPPSAGQPHGTHSPAHQSARGSKILLIDDGQAVRDVIRIFLEKEGLHICGEAADGVEAIEQAKRLRPDLIILDLAMPRMNGVETASVLSRTMPGVPIVVLTMYDEFLGRSLTSASGIRAVISKADSLSKLVACVKSLLTPAPNQQPSEIRGAGDAPRLPE